MAHMKKFTRAACGHMFNHYDRREENIGNENLDPERTHLNYNLAPVRESQGDFIRQRCSEIRMLNRKDVNVMVTWVLTAPADLPETDRRQFFQAGYDFMSARYGGEKNIVSAYVHMDEVSPHMHFAFVPVVTDKKRGGEKLSAHEAIDRKDLLAFHKDLSRYMERVFGRDVGIENGAVKENGGNLSVPQLRAATARASELRNNNDNLQSSIDERYERQKQEFAKADELKRMEIENAKTEARQIRAAAEAEAARIIGASPIERDRAVQERDDAAQNTARIAAERTNLQSEVESNQKRKNALESEIRGLTAQKAEWRSSLRRENDITAVGEEVKPLIGESYIKCKPGEFAELKKAATGNFALAIRAQTAENTVTELKKEMETKMISRFAHDREISEIKFQYRNKLQASDTENKKIKTQADRRITFIHEKGLGDEYKAWVDAHRQQEQPRSQGMER